MKKTDETKNIKLHVYAEKWNHSETFKVAVTTHLPESCEYRTIIELSVVHVDIKVPLIDEKQLITAQVEQLKKVIQKEKADSHVRVTAIEEKIQSLLCLEN